MGVKPVCSGKEGTYQLEDDFHSCILEVCALFQSDMYRPRIPRVRQSLINSDHNIPRLSFTSAGSSLVSKGYSLDIQACHKGVN